MTSRTWHPLAADYMHRFDKEARRLSRGRRHELRSEIEDHLTQAIPAGATDTHARTVLDRLGQPEEILDAEQPLVPDRRGTREWAAIFLLLLGSFIGGIGWIVGVILLWSSRAWNTRDKLIGTFILPGGLIPVFVFAIIGGAAATQQCESINNGPEHCTGSGSTPALQIALAVLLLLAPIATSVYLARRARQGHS